MKLAAIFATLLVSSSAMFMNTRPSPAMSGPVPSGGPPSPDPAAMPDMGLVMRMVRQILMMLLPKLLANPSLASNIIGGGKGLEKPGPAPPMSGPPSPFMGGNSGPMGGNPSPMGGNSRPMGGNPFGMNPMNIFSSPPSPAAPRPMMAGPGFVSSSDKMKDMRLITLLQDPTVGLQADPYVKQYIPRGGLPFYGLSLPDIAKDQILFTVQRKASQRGFMTPKEHEIISLIGDPVEMMPHMGTNIRPM